MSNPPDFVDFKVKACRCPSCDVELSAATSVRHDKSPESGDPTVCLGCGALLRFEADLTVRALTEPELWVLPGEMLDELNEVRGAILRLQASRPAKRRARSGE